MSIIETKYGEIQVKEDQIIFFSEGIPGFEDCTKYILLDIEGHEPFRYLQSIDEPALSFAVVSPFIFFPTYEFDLSEHVTNDLELNEEIPIGIYSIVSIRSDSLETATVNLVAPLIINELERKGKQVILTQQQYSTRHLLFASEEVR